MKRPALLLLVTGMLMLLATAIYQNVAYDKHTFAYSLEAFKQFASNRSQTLDLETKRLSDSTCPDFSQTDRFKSAAANGLFWFVYTSEDILFWSSNEVPLTSDMIRNKPDTLIWKLKNGWYLAKRYPSKNCTILGLALLRNEYSYQNEYLENDWYGSNNFLLDLHLPGDKVPRQIIWREPLSANLMAISPADTDQPGLPLIKSASATDNPALWLFLAGCLLFFVGGHRLWAKKKPLYAGIWWLTLLAARICSFIYQTPIALYDLPLFSPNDYAASDWLPTLGDLLVNVILALYGCMLFFKHRERIARIRLKHSALLLLCLNYFFTVFTLNNLRGLIIHSSISLDFSDIFNISSSSFIAFLIFVLCFAAIFLISEVFRISAGYNKTPIYLSLATIAALTIAGIIFIPFIGDVEPYILAAFLLICLLALGKTKVPYSHTRIISMMALFALTGNYLILHETSNRELEKRKLLAAKISAERDPIAESLFHEIEGQLLSDTLLKSYLRPTTIIPPGQVRDLAQLYFNGYWEKYNIVVNVFGTDECPLTNLYTTPISDPLIFDRQIDSIGIPTQSHHFFYMDKGSGRISYMARLQIPDTTPNQVLGTLYIEFLSRYTPEEIGYPELLLDQMVSSKTDMSNYSYARYREGNLVSHFGTYSYPFQNNNNTFAAEQPFRLEHKGGFEHLFYQASPHSTVVLSLPERSLIALLSPFSYLMLISGILVLLTILLIELQTPSTLALSFKLKIQFFIIGILLIALFMVSVGTLVFLTKNNISKNQQALSEKIHSVLVETEYNLARDEQLNPFKANDLGYLLTKQANIFFADINLFDPSGQLFASSRPKIFEEGLMSKKMHPAALFEMKFKQNTEFIHEEKTGKLKYLSAYVPVRNNENKLIAYLNLPYFARQSELKREISVFLVTIINIYVLLIVLVVIAAIFLSNRITEPLRLIQERLGRIRLGRQNEIIAWKGNDEIASLIGEYNRMVAELAESAEKLARSERESAWREMAKQVAHEIKNPLTPIKLSIQHLNRAWHDNAPDFEQRLDRFAKTLIEQIDTLSHIATEFSNFAQMPRMVIEQVDLHEMLHNVVDFFSKDNNIECEFTTTETGKCLTLSDREQLLRVFNNLIRNAIQSIPEGNKGLIQVSLTHNEKAWVIAVSDNGSGIPLEIREKIFYPNFTTRTGGMGLGLALVKSIIESSGGSVEFSTALNQGSTFYVYLPLIK
ncbi:MAG: GHKL domain-containing protein [Bacteroidia bacterium]|nr:GHKL domain-containing protein [Bacteroidia bacterium]